MSVTITEVTSNKFSLNGIIYFKNYTPVVKGNYISIVNTYDARNVLVQPKLYSEYTVDGSTYGTVALLQAALVDVIYTRDTLGNGGTAVWGTITGDITNQDDLMALLPQGQAPVENIYTNISELLSFQVNQTTNFLQLVEDASDDPTVASGKAYYQKLVASTADLDDYYKLNDAQAAAIDAGQGTETEDCGTVIPLDTIYGHNCNYSSANANTAYTVDNQNIINAYARVKINAPSEPSVSGATQQGGIAFQADTDLILLVQNLGDAGLTYSFHSLGISTGEASTSSHRVNVLDFFSSDTHRDNVINRETGQDVTETTTAIEDAVQYCIDNDIRELVFGSGLYITDRILFSNTDNFSIIGEGATMQFYANKSIFQFVNCDNVTITGFEFTSTVATDQEVYFLRIQNNNSYFKIFNNRFSNFPRNAIIADNLSGGTYTEGITVYMNEFVDSPNYSNPLQAAIALGEDGEYSKVINNNFYNVPSAARFVDGANGLFAYNNVLNCNGDAYDASYDNAIVYSEFDTNSGKLDVVYNKINHNPTGIPAIVIKGDPTKPQNACKIQGNDVLVHGSTTKSMAFYIKDAPYTIIDTNKIRGNSGTPNDNAIHIEDSNEVHVDKNYIAYYNNGVNIVTSTNIYYGENNFTDITTDNYVLDASSNILKSTNYGGEWNASTNTPTLANTDTNVIGTWRRVSHAGSVDFGAGSITFAVGDIIANNGTIWYKKVDNNQSGGGTPAGSNGQLQYNDSGSFGASDTFTIDNADNSILAALVGKIKAYASYIGLESTSTNNIRLTTFGTGTHVGINKDNTAVSSLYLGTEGGNYNAQILMRGENAADASDPTEYVAFVMKSGGLFIDLYKGNYWVDGGAWLFNTDNEDLDFRVDGTADNLIRTDANNNRVGIGVSPTQGKLEVNGKIHATDINFSGLPTSSSGLSSGDVWNDAGTLKIV